MCLARSVSIVFLVASFVAVGTASIDVTYLADTFILLRFFEASGRVRRAISVIKKRTGAHEDTIREFKISSGGLSLGQPLHHFHGVLRGIPTYIGKTMPPLEEPPS